MLRFPLIVYLGSKMEVWPEKNSHENGASYRTEIINTTATEQTAKLLAPSNKPAAVLYQADRTELQRWPNTPTELPLTLELFGVRMRILR